MRWSKVWHFAVMHICKGEAQIDPKGAALMSARELQLYSASRQSRNLVVMQLRRLIVRAGIVDDEVWAATRADACVHVLRGPCQ